MIIAPKNSKAGNDFLNITFKNIFESQSTSVPSNSIWRSSLLTLPPKGLEAHTQLPTNQPVSLFFNQKGHHPIRLNRSSYIRMCAGCRDLTPNGKNSNPPTLGLTRKASGQQQGLGWSPMCKQEKTCVRFAWWSLQSLHLHFSDPCDENDLRGHSTPTSHLGDKADFTPSPLKGSGSNRGCLTGETYDVVRSYGICSYRAGFSHPPYAPSKPLQPRRENGAERNRTAVRNTGVDHLVRSRTDSTILASRSDS